ncbi:ABC transporter ATP-binding protein [Corynebacterium kozikiae]|uniref:ABC transporter ATP-binding protein n=1 Tax=Corynebacterium kozikiae TaxID=2968469 RepID=UPI00211CA183|nr:ABC transporter ATP-binding protein [Corynebacterium sp. 76QC2CO]MCQ9342827.1 ABC transporter ATP-binding protein [Corynebacterium sp. 76QC2CO]
MPGPALEVRGVSKRFGAKTAVDNVSFSLNEGEVLALLGPNGAGKTTTIEMCEGFQTPDQGSISVLGMDPSSQADAVRAQVGIMLQGGGSYTGIRAGEALRLAASYSENPLDPAWLLELLGLQNVEKTSYRRLSGGQQQRLSLAMALVGRPRLVFLDEPTAGMDSQSRHMVWELLRALRADGVAAVLTTHLMDEAEALADSVVIIDHGKVVACGSPAQLRGSNAANASFSTEVALPVEMRTRLGAVETRPLHYRLTQPATPALLAEVAHACAQEGILITQWSTHQQSLEDVFLEITGHELRS